MPEVLEPHVRRSRLPTQIPPSILRHLTVAMCKPRNLPPLLVRVIAVSGETETETLVRKSLFMGFYTDGFDNVLLSGSGVINHNDRYYRPTTLKLAGFCGCSECGSIFAITSIVEGKCRSCRGEIIPWMASKSIPSGGWRKHGEGDAHFGLELEIEYHDTGLGKRDFINKLNRPLHLPLVWTDDCSLRCGVEFNSHPMSLAHIEQHNDSIAAFFAELKANGASHIAYDRTITAAIHIHASKNIFAADAHLNEALNLWMFKHREDIKAIGMRTENRFVHWCNIREEVDTTNDRRAYLNMRGETVEVRGFSSEVLLTDHTALPRLCAWIATLGKASKTSPEEWMLMSPQALVRWAGFAYSGFPDEARMSLAAWEVSKNSVFWKAEVAAYKKALVCSPVSLHPDVTEYDFQEVGLGTTTLHYARDSRRAVCRQLTGSGRMAVSFLLNDGTPHNAEVHWQHLQHATIPRPARSAPCAS